jgi:hypothetical protein
MLVEELTPRLWQFGISREERPPFRREKVSSTHQGQMPVQGTRTRFQTTIYSSHSMPTGEEEVPRGVQFLAAMFQCAYIGTL